jgi:hypothetical protein
MPRRALLIAGAIIILFAVVLLTWWFYAGSDSNVQTESYQETFDSIGTWTTGEDVNAIGMVTGGVYEMSLEQSGDIFWVTAGQAFADGEYQVEITPIEGAQDNGYGMLFRVNEEDESFYVFKVSSDGFAFVGHCSDSCLEQRALVGQDWFATPAVKQGFDVTNSLRAVISGSDMIFYINGEEVGRASDDALSQGDIGLMAETFTPGGLRVTFDNFTVTPLLDE